jgi:hypothetical protein
MAKKPMRKGVKGASEPLPVAAFPPKKGGKKGKKGGKK